MRKRIGRYVGVFSAAQSCPTIPDPMDYSPPGSSCSWNFSGKNTGVGCHFPPPGHLLNPVIKSACLVSPALAKPLLLCLTLCDPMDVALQVPLSLGFERQGPWSGCCASSQADSILVTILDYVKCLFFFSIFPPNCNIMSVSMFTVPKRRF